MAALLTTNLPFPVFRRGKVRDVYDLGAKLLIVATDRISAFDCVMLQGIPDKGRILTAVANYWFGATADLIPNQLIATKVEDYPAELQPHAELLRGRSILVKKTRPLPVECVVRGFLAGSGWKEYQATRSVCGIPLPSNLSMASKLPEPIFTPAAKADMGHDENISFERFQDLLGDDMAGRLRSLSLQLYRRGSEIALNRGILLADTKFEFGVDDDDQLLLIDEALTPDSSRYWPADGWRPGTQPPSLDKQFLRDYLERLPDWTKQPPAPDLPSNIIEGVRSRYMDLATRFGIEI